jgi:site-specific DNA-cytosine methylase
MCVVYGVDCRNANIEVELTHTLQAHSGGGTSLNCTPSIVQKLASGADATGTLMACHAQKQWIGNQEAFSGNYHIIASGKSRKYIIRRLTPLECDRLQGYPDNWSQVSYKGKPMSDSARYRMDGNSVAIPCVVRVLGGIAAETQDLVSV